MQKFSVSILTLYPEMFPGCLGFSLAGKALELGIWSLDVLPIRNFSSQPHRNVDDTPYGGGAGMVMRADVLASAIDFACPLGDERPRFLMSPRGHVLNQERARKLSRESGLVIICGRFEGVDQRVIDGRKLEEISIGDYILSGGEPAAMVFLDSVIRLLPGVMGNPESSSHESFSHGLLQHPHYTRPDTFEGKGVPPVLLSGNHRDIARWRLRQAQEITSSRRPDLFKNSIDFIKE